MPAKLLTENVDGETKPTEEKIKVIGPEVTTWIKSSAPPPAPELLYVIPTFGWVRSEDETTKKSWRRGGGLRVYLNRPWNVSGYGEMLAVILPPANFKTLIVAAAFAALTLSSGAHSHTNRQGTPERVHCKTLGNSRVPVFNSGIEVYSTLAPDQLSDSSIFYSVRPDLRRCISPVCGGYFVKRVNQLRTRCANGTWMSDCYVAEIDWNNQPRVDPAKALLRGSVVVKTLGTFGNLGALHVTESWQAVTDRRPNGSVYRMRDRGVRCITFPCPTYQEAKLNSTFVRNIAGVDLTALGMEANDRAKVFAAMTGTDAALLAGTHVSVRGSGGRSLELKATQVYLHVQPQSSTLACMKTGCSRQVCADHNVITTCEFRPEYACYEKAHCERQSDGNCGFTRTAELTACLTRR